MDATEHNWLECIAAADALCRAVQEHAENGTTNRYFAMNLAAWQYELAREKLDDPMTGPELLDRLRPGSSGWAACRDLPERSRGKFRVDL